MRATLPLIALLCANAAAAETPRAPIGSRTTCRDRIEQVRTASGQPRLDRENAAPDRPMLIAAVDKRIDGCSVMVMYHDMSDIRPIPRAEDNGRLRRIR